MCNIYFNKNIMKQVKDYFQRPDTWVKIWVWLFALWMAWSLLNSKVNILTDRLDKIEALDLSSRLTKIEVDVQWIRQTLENKYE